LKPWEVYQWKFPRGEHPAVIVTPAARCENPDIETVHVLGCSSKEARRAAGIHEVLLDRADCEVIPNLSFSSHRCMADRLSTS
jgi:hypothetical protein